MLEKSFLLLVIILWIDLSDEFSFDPFRKNDSSTDSTEGLFSRRELVTIPIAAGGALFYGKVLSDATKKLLRGDLVYPDSHENRVKSTIAKALTASIPPIQSSSSSSEKEPTNDDNGIGQPLRILEVGIGKDCRVIRRGLYNDAFKEISARGIANVNLIGIDVVSPTTTALEKAKDVLQQNKENNLADVSFEFVKGSLTSRLDFQDGYFDCVICTLTLCSVDDQIAALNEIKRVLRKDGGSFGYIEHVAVNPDEPYRLLELQQRAFDPLQQKLVDNCHLRRFTEENIANVFGVSDGMSRQLAKERFLVNDMWPVSCQTSGVITLS